MRDRKEAGLEKKVEDLQFQVETLSLALAYILVKYHKKNQILIPACEFENLEHNKLDAFWNEETNTLLLRVVNKYAEKKE